jgi:nicotinamidase-related amidase
MFSILAIGIALWAVLRLPPSGCRDHRSEYDQLRTSDGYSLVQAAKRAVRDREATLSASGTAGMAGGSRFAFSRVEKRQRHEARLKRRAHGTFEKTLIISGAETDVCVLSTVLDAVDLGYRVIVAEDALRSSSDEGHDMLLRLYHSRYSEQIETASCEIILSRWC